MSHPRHFDDSGRYAASCVAEGALAAVLGLAVLGAGVLLLWAISPYPDDSADGALRIAADLWLAAHGAALARDSGLHGGTVPVDLAPLLLTALPCFLLRRAVRPYTGQHLPPREGVTVAALHGGGYLLVAAAAVVFTVPAPLRADPLSAVLCLPPFVLLLTLPWPAWASRAARAAAAGVVAACAVGGALAAGALLARAGEAGAAFGRIGGAWAGGIAVALLCAVLLPNAAVWAAAYGLGPGFSAGAGTVLAPLAAAPERRPALPAFPLLAAVPAGPPADVLTWSAVAAVPAAAVLTGAWYVARDAGAVREPWRVTARNALLAAAGSGAAFGALAAFAGGSLGTGGLAAFGPSPWLTAGAATAWHAVLGVPLALLIRWRLLRHHRLPVPAPAQRRPRLAVPRVAQRWLPERRQAADRWHETRARRTRWAALRASSGVLVPGFPAEHRDPPGGQPPVLTRDRPGP
ncbi:DUF6350 family protein [Streptomyces sp. 7-21]|uniref:cell division protein PerM n=1 Tax=Streptomyces sp. 7-21 TaxID=2802283 RepID=UPI00191DD697|nr:DUF6350 family protein [Streptomyces sp. 7-21]MBL1065700.1 hypothetical protein [Streptomyces sp. 7-21]